MLLKFAINALKSSPKHSRFLSSAKDYYIERAKPCDHDQMLKLVMHHFLTTEPLSLALIPEKKPELLKRMFRRGIEQGYSKVAKKCETGEMIGVCINTISTREQGEDLIKQAKEADELNLKKLFQTLVAIEVEPKLNDLLCVDATFSLEILTVNKEYRGKGLGMELIVASMEFGKREKFKYSRANCVNEITKTFAERLKMTRAWCCPYKTLLCRDGNPPQALPEAPHLNAYVYYLDLAKLQKPKNEKLKK